MWLTDTFVYSQNQFFIKCQSLVSYYFLLTAVNLNVIFFDNFKCIVFSRKYVASALRREIFITSMDLFNFSLTLWWWFLYCNCFYILIWVSLLSCASLGAHWRAAKRNTVRSRWTSSHISTAYWNIICSFAKDNSQERPGETQIIQLW